MIDTLPKQTDVDRALHVFDQHGVPFLWIDGVGLVHHPAWTATYALTYGGEGHYDDVHIVKPDQERFKACVRWLKGAAVDGPAGGAIWEYPFDTTYNDVHIKAPWHSAFGQAVIIQALLLAFQKGDQDALQLARRAAESMFVPIEAGGLLFRRGEDIWFEEVPAPADNPSHILNGHMRALIALAELLDATGDAILGIWLERGLDTLVRWLPMFDAGYALRYDLNPRKTELLFRITNPFGAVLAPIAFRRALLRDCSNGAEEIIAIGASGDAEGQSRIAGIHWQQPQDVDGSIARRLCPVRPDAGRSANSLSTPCTFLYLNLPRSSIDNLSQKDFEIEMEYFDDFSSNISIQMRSITSGPSFRDMRDGDLFLSGSGIWRTWRVPLAARDLGYWVGPIYMQKHAEYLERLTRLCPSLEAWALLARGYQRLSSGQYDEVTVCPPKLEIPAQTPLIGIYSIDDNGVIRQHLAGPESRMNARSMWDGASMPGPPQYSPFVIAEQALKGEKIFDPASLMDISRLEIFDKIENLYAWLQPHNLTNITGKDAYRWLLKNAVTINTTAGPAVIWCFDFLNAYNDIVSEPPWQSAFGQTYVLKALLQAVIASMDLEDIDWSDFLQRAIRPYIHPVKEGGLVSFGREITTFFEEVPNGSHVLNAHLVTTCVMYEIWSTTGNQIAAQCFHGGIRTLRRLLNRFDSGYWLLYDQNPRKEIVLQIDWLSGPASFALSDATLINPQTGHVTNVNVGDANHFSGLSRLSGIDWAGIEVFAGDRCARTFRNGYLQRNQAVPTGHRHNVFLIMTLPDQEFIDYFDVGTHVLRIRYFDLCRGRFSINIQAINEGNFLKFVPLRDARIECAGDLQWKTAILEVRPQDLGWFVGYDYQSFHVQQLRNLAQITGDWYFSQLADRNENYLELQKVSKVAIEQPATEWQNGGVRRLSGLLLRHASPTYPEHEFSIVAELDNGYAAVLEDAELPHFVEFEFESLKSIVAIVVKGEGAKNFPNDFSIALIDSSGDIAAQVFQRDFRTHLFYWHLDSSVLAKRVRYEASSFVGEKRLLLRAIEVYSMA